MAEIPLPMTKREETKMTETATKLEKIAIVTYNRIGEGKYENGVLNARDKQIYIAQNGHLAKWAYNPNSGTREEAIDARQRAARSVASQIALDEMDKIFIYVGNSGGEEAIRQTRGLPANKVTYVMCDCNMGQKKSMIRHLGNEDAKIIYCECGGRETLQRILDGILKN